MAMQRGVISRMGKRGFGFITPMADGPAVFFHIKECSLRNSYSALQVGDKVEFLVNPFARDGKGRQRACEVRPVK
jgi:cold shock CspA family protein